MCLLLMLRRRGEGSDTASPILQRMGCVEGVVVSGKWGHFLHSLHLRIVCAEGIVASGTCILVF